MQRIRVGSTIRCKYDNTTIVAKVTNIEICIEGMNNGRKVKTCHPDSHMNGVVDLDCGVWAYFYKIQKVLKY